MKHNHTLYLSFGENCLPDNILKRHGLKSFTTPYSHGRSNIEYILQIEKDRFKHFLNPKCLRYEESCGHRVPRLKIYNEIHNTYDKLHMNGFEFTHHDVIGNPEHRDALKRRAKRMLKIRNCHLIIFYHHRYCLSTDFSQLLDDLNKLRLIYLKRCRAVDVVLFHQSLIKDPSDRKLEYSFAGGIHVFTFYTTKVWSGNDQDVFWARVDDDLIKEMLNMITNGQIHPTDTAQTSLISRWIRRIFKRVWHKLVSQKE